LSFCTPKLLGDMSSWNIRVEAIREYSRFDGLPSYQNKTKQRPQYFGTQADIQFPSPFLTLHDTMASPPSLLTPEALSGILDEINLNTPVLARREAKMDSPSKNKNKNKENIPLTTSRPSSPSKNIIANAPIDPAYQAYLRSVAASSNVEEQAHPFILQIFFNGVLTKIYRDETGLYVKHHEEWPPLASEQILNLK
jgi:hypothetical protein